MSLPSLPSRSSEASGKVENYPIYEVMTERAPFYLNHSPEGIGGAKSHPYIYLTKGMTVTLLTHGKRYGKVSLINGMKGWMPISTLAPQMATGAETSPGVRPLSSGAGAVGAGSGPQAGNFNPGNGIQLPSY